MAGLRIVVAEDHPDIRAIVQSALEAHPDLTVVAAVGDGEAAWNAVRELQPDVLVTDVRMPRLSGLALARQLRQQGTTIGIVVLTSEDAIYHPALATLGCVVVDKAAPLSELVAAVRRIAPQTPQ
jgi:two-component system, NarL family, response regulator DesR